MDEKFWLAVSFFTFLAFLLKYVRPYLIKAIDGHSQKIAEEINAAKDARQKAEKLLEDAKEYLEESKTYSDELIFKSREEAQKIINDVKHKVEEEANKKMTAAVDRVKAEEERVIRDFKIDIIEGSINRFEEIIANEMTDQEKTAINEKSSNEIKSLLSS